MKLFKTVRGQLSFYFVLVFGITLCIFSAVLYSVFARQNRAEFDKAMITFAKTISEEMQQGGFQSGTSKDITESFVPFSTPKQQYLEIRDELSQPVFKLREFDLPLNHDLFNESLNGNPIFETVYDDAENKFWDSYGVRILLYPVSYKSEKNVIVIAVSLSNLESTLFKFRLILYIAIPLTLLLSSILGWVFSGKAYAPVSELIKNSNRITANNLDTRLPVSDSGDEISKLAATLNSMMERLQRSFLVLKQFTSDASHELRTPLTILKGEIEVALNKERTAEEYERILKDNLDEVERLQMIVDGLLTLSRLESGKKPQYSERVNLDELLIEAVSKISYMAGMKNIKIILKFNEENNDEYKQLFVRGDLSMLLNVFMNLLENAVKYSNPDSEIICSEIFIPSENTIHISIQDNGIGISPEDLDKVFDRFYRADHSRTRDGRHGIGLGLSIAKSVIEAHNGNVSVKSNPGSGTVFTVILPGISEN
ncbi:MAG: HAMP domain-containing protein [Ignavibacteria bacterium]|nr:HAMP domain-containing protein [Ignavibacteria bacterium]